MRNLHIGALVAGAAAGALIAPASAAAATRAHSAAAGPAAGDPVVGSANTNVTFSVTSGVVTITAPSDWDLGSGTPGTTIGPTLAPSPITVTDRRGVSPANWSVQVFGDGDFRSGTSTIPLGDAAYFPDGVTAIPATASVSTTDILHLSTTPQTTVDVSTSGGNSASWDPRMEMHVPDNAVVGDYTAVLTHQVTVP